MQVDKEKIMSELGITDDFCNELIQDFIDQVEASIGKLDKALETDNFDEIMQIGHFIKGAAGNLRLEEIQNITKDIEDSARTNKDKKIIEESTTRLKTVFKELKEIPK